MEDMIQRVLEIDSKARESAARLEGIRAGSAQVIREKRDQIRTDYMARAQHRIDLVEQTEQSDAEKAIAEKQAHYDDLMRQLNAQCAQNHDAWVDAIYARVIA